MEKMLFSEDMDLEEMFLSSDSDSDSDEDLEVAEQITLQHNTRNDRCCVKGYEEEVVAKYSDKEFISHFRLSRDKVHDITEGFSNCDIYKDLIKNPNSRASITPYTHILVFLWFVGHQTASFRDVCDRFNVCLKSLHVIIHRVSSYLCSIAEDVIRWPSAEEQGKTKQYFLNKTGFPHIIGSIDGTHIKIDKPTERHVDYCNRKGFYSIILQVVCDENKKFTDIFVGFPGSAHDAWVFRNSSLFEQLANTNDSSIILGDSAYPLSHNLITPFRDNGHLTRQQKAFNTKLSQCRVYVENTIGLLKQRFRQLYHLKLRGHKRICQFIKACCVLHNMGSEDDANIFNNESSVDEDIQPDTLPWNTPTGNRHHVRDQIFNHLFGE